jgi:homoserine dehydrogenase
MAKSLNCAIKLLAIAKRHADGKVEVRVHPTMVHNRYLLASVNNVYNAVRVTSDAAGDTVHYGKGAGGAATSSAVTADIINIARNIAADSIGRVPVLGFAQPKDAEVVDIADISSEFYMRLDVKDAPGVLSTAAGILAKNGISIRSALQRATEEGSTSVPLVFLTSNISGRQLAAAVDEISKMETVYNKPVVIRVME